MINKKIFRLRLILIIISFLFLVESSLYACSIPKYCLRPFLAGNSAVTVEQLIENARIAMGPAGESNRDWTAFNNIVEQIRAKKGIQVWVVAGSTTNDAARKGLKFNYRCSENPLLRKQAEIFFNGLSSKETIFIGLILENSALQHVSDGITLIVVEKKHDFSKISIIDNGKGFKDEKRDNGKVKIETAVKYGSFGRGGDRGIGLSSALNQNSDIAEVHQPEESAILRPSERSVYDPVVVYQIRNNRAYGTTVIGYFFKGKGTDNLDAWRTQKIIELRQSL